MSNSVNERNCRKYNKIRNCTYKKSFLAIQWALTKQKMIILISPLETSRGQTQKKIQFIGKFDKLPWVRGQWHRRGKRRNKKIIQPICWATKRRLQLHKILWFGNSMNFSDIGRSDIVTNSIIHSQTKIGDGDAFSWKINEKQTNSNFDCDSYWYVLFLCMRFKPFKCHDSYCCCQ